MSDALVSHNVVPGGAIAPALTRLHDARPPFDWSVFVIDHDTHATLGFDHRLDFAGRLRLTLAAGVRGPATLDATLQDGRPLASFDLTDATPLQLLDVRLNASQTQLASERGIRLVQTSGNTPLAFFDRARTYATFSPRLVAPARVNRLDAMLARLDSPATLAPFGTPAAAVVHALLDLNHPRTAAEHLVRYVNAQGPVYEDHRGRPCDGVVRAVEHGAFYAALARAQPAHPAVAAAAERMLLAAQPDGVIRDRLLTAEQNLTVAYPLAVLAEALRDPQLAEEAAKQLRIRRDSLRHHGRLYLRAGRGAAAPKGSLPNLAVGVGAYLLGLARALALLPGRGVEDLVRDANQTAHWAAGMQRPDGLWNAVIGHPDAPTDTLGSATLGAALAVLSNDPRIRAGYHDAAEAALAGLATKLTPDGMLGGALPSLRTRDVDALVRSDRRVISQAAMGFTGQLIAALG